MAQWECSCLTGTKSQVQSQSIKRKNLFSTVFRGHPTECSPYFQKRHQHQSLYICNHQHSPFPAFSIVRKTAKTPVSLFNSLHRSSSFRRQPKAMATDHMVLGGSCIPPTINTRSSFPSLALGFLLERAWLIKQYATLCLFQTTLMLCISLLW